MKAKGVGILAIVVVLIAIGAYFATRPSGGGADDSLALPNSLAPLLGGGDGVPSALLITRGEESLRVFVDESSPTGWRVAERDGYPANAERVRTVLVGLERLRPLEPKTDNPALFGRLGLDDPETPGSESARLRVVAGEDEADVQADLILGTQFYEGPSKRVYARLGDPASVSDGRAYLCEGGFATETDPLLWVLREFIAVPADEIAGVVVRHPDGDTVAARRVAESRADFELIELAEGMVVTDPAALRRLGNAIGRVQLAEVQPRAESAVSFDEAIETVFTTNGGVEVVVRTIEDDEWGWVMVEVVEGDVVAEDGRWADLSALTGDWVYRVPAYVRRDLTPRLDDVVAAQDDGG